jgi:hypothetical protein
MLVHAKLPQRWCGGTGALTLAESILEATGQVLHVPHAASAGGLPADSLDGPVV